MADYFDPVVKHIYGDPVWLETALACARRGIASHQPSASPLDRSMVVIVDGAKAA